MLLRDPIHGDIELNPAEVEIADLGIVQRLRGIKQLGTAHLVYPGALHTRFDHSVGVCAVAHEIVDALRDSGLHVTRDLETAIGVAALLHDVTHVPFGHTLEDERRLFDRHDEGSRLAQMFSGELGLTLERLGLRDIVGHLLGLPSNERAPRWARDIVSGCIDADLLDYLRRDSYFAGLSQNYDDRIFRCFAERDDRLVIRLARHGMDRPDARSEIIGVLRLRYYLTERVYYHHTKVAAGAMISKAVETAVAHGALVESDLLELNDWTLLDRLGRCGIAGATALARRTSRRDLLKRGYVVSGRSVPADRRTEWVALYHSSPSTRARLEAEFAGQLGLDFADVVVYCPALTMMKEATAPVETIRGVELLNDRGNEAFGEIGALQDRYADLWRFYVFVPEQAVVRAAAVAADMLGLPSELGPKSA
ncbi:HD domain-containing protein [Paraburkholderia guartelaensis]|uniref:HD domain-containing protein n=1 Tax=Paraburkholderia guartelaensis TaxID=2546446 RepID=A0A4R5L6J6_9BURK|nr:HD domain-containing protein [Paraburkholderia guartelaensis]TDG04434.1 HD domain-containing protein [Paraburkholderia guartelaensis]